MTRLRLRPYRIGDDPAPASVPVSVIILARDEESNIRRCLASVAWADQVIVVDSGSSDQTVPIARSLGAQVVEQRWLGFSGQREFALHLRGLRHDWVYFVDADEWVSPELATEIASRLRDPRCAAFSHRLRLVFLGTWIRHCGWYSGSWVVRLVDRRHTSYDDRLVSERAQVDGPVRRLRNDIVDEDWKGLAAWLHKHVRYADLMAVQRSQQRPWRERVRSLRSKTDTRRLAHALLTDAIFPAVPAKPLSVFIYMYILRAGWLDGKAGLRFCAYHAWFQMTVGALMPDRGMRSGHGQFTPAGKSTGEIKRYDDPTSGADAIRQKHACPADSN